jgi:hypothetical protein
VTTSASIALTLAATGETNTLAIPTFVGQQLSLTANTVAGGATRIITASQGVNQTGNTVLTFAQARDTVLLTAITVSGALRWQVVSNDGVALS